MRRVWAVVYDPWPQAAVTIAAETIPDILSQALDLVVSGTAREHAIRCRLAELRDMAAQPREGP